MTSKKTFLKRAISDDFLQENGTVKPRKKSLFVPKEEELHISTFLKEKVN
jgi:hypothetical protein